MDADFERNVFINCPFDNKYKNELLKPILFSLCYLNFVPRIATERYDSMENRLKKITDLIKVSKYSIHDISRMVSTKKNETARLNMPFELGIDYGHFLSNEDYSSKKFLVVAKGRYMYQKALSDIAGCDIQSHEDKPMVLIRIIRNWFEENEALQNSAPGQVIWDKYGEFTTFYYNERVEEGHNEDDIEALPVPTFIRKIQEWVVDHR